MSFLFLTEASQQLEDPGHLLTLFAIVDGTSVQSWIYSAGLSPNYSTCKHSPYIFVCLSSDCSNTPVRYNYDTRECNIYSHKRQCGCKCKIR